MNPPDTNPTAAPTSCAAACAPGALAAAWDLVKDWEVEDHERLRRDVTRLGLKAEVAGRSVRDIAVLREVQRLSQSDGVNLAGIKTIIELSEQIEELEGELETQRGHNEELRQQLQSGSRRGGELVHVPRSTAVVAWEPAATRRRRRSAR